MLKKTTLAIISLAASSFASAGGMDSISPPPCVPVEVTVPCETCKWDLGVQALYFQPVYSAGKAFERAAVASRGRLLEREQFINYKSSNPDLDWGYRIEGSYHFFHDNDLTMTLIHLDNSTNHGPSYASLTSFSLTANLIPHRIHLENKFDQVNLVFGQHVDFSDRKHARFYAGMQAAKIRVDERNDFSEVPITLRAIGVLGFSQYRDADFLGVGPVIGVDYAFNLFHGLSLTANAASSVLYGSTRFADGYVLAPGAVDKFHNKFANKILVPSFETKLGLRYDHQCCHGGLGLEGGFQALNYFNVIRSRGQAVLGEVYASDFGLIGPYFGAKWIGDV